MTGYSVTEAAKRVKKSRRTIERWIRDGLPVVAIRDTRGRVIMRFIEEDELLRHFRRALRENPTRNRGERGDAPP